MCNLPVADVSVTLDERERESDDISSSKHILCGSHELCGTKENNALVPQLFNNTPRHYE